jgi:putative tryptophan/tyrosine transport system substrate-binding protein
MLRREFNTLLASALSWPIIARAQQPEKLRTVGILGPDASSWSPWTAAFAERLRSLGWIEGLTVHIEYRWSEGHPERYPEIATEFVQGKVDVIVTFGGAVTTLKQATATIPIVFAIAVDPIGAGLVANLSHPGGNVTGLSLQQTDIAGKRLGLLSEVLPRLRRLAIMFDPDYPAAELEIGRVQNAARSLGIEVVPHEIRQAENIGSVFGAFRSQVDALYVVGDAFVSANSTQIIALALAARLPTIFNSPDTVHDGGLMSYGPNFPALFRRTADFVDSILRGTRPGDIPVEQPTNFELVINLKTARALGLDVPAALIATADNVIE